MEKFTLTQTQNTAIVRDRFIPLPDWIILPPHRPIKFEYFNTDTFDISHAD